MRTKPTGIPTCNHFFSLGGAKPQIKVVLLSLDDSLIDNAPGKYMVLTLGSGQKNWGGAGGNDESMHDKVCTVFLVRAVAPESLQGVVS